MSATVSHIPCGGVRHSAVIRRQPCAAGSALVRQRDRGNFCHAWNHGTVHERHTEQCWQVAVTTKDSGTAAPSIAGGSPHRPEQLKNLKRLHLDLCTRLTAEERKDHASRVKAAGPSGTRKRDEAFQATRRRPPTTPRSTRSRSVRGSSRFLSTLQTVTLCLDAGFATR